VHDLLQVGETRRFIDEIDYLMDGLDTASNSPQIVRESLQDLVRKAVKGSNSSDFGLKLKSHGALATIFETVSNAAKLDKTIQLYLIVLVTGLLYDVRRLDFFFKVDLMLILAKHCIIEYSEDDDSDNNDDDDDNTNTNTNSNNNNHSNNNSVFRCEMEKYLKESTLFSSIDCSKWTLKNIYNYIGLWILSKWSFSSITTSSSSYSSSNCEFFCPNLINKIISFFSNESNSQPPEISEKAAILLDCLLNNTAISSELWAKIDLAALLASLPLNSIDSMKLAVSITGSPMGIDYLTVPAANQNENESFGLVRKLVQISFASCGLGEEQAQIQILALSCLINLVDRCEEAVIDEFRFVCMVQDSKESLLQLIVKRFFDENETSATSELSALHKSLHALLLGFLCRLNRTNLAVVKDSAASDATLLLSEMEQSASKFLSQANEKDEGLIERLNDILKTIK
jgi:hypothetical protein